VGENLPVKSFPHLIKSLVFLKDIIMMASVSAGHEQRLINYID